MGGGVVDTDGEEVVTVEFIISSKSKAGDGSSAGDGGAPDI